ncbi:MAG: thiamine pyrophosphate-dependent enzyme [Geobacteraceae bacterium]|nr:thiamine pyrophosphate-dependent enzyme [Geobacteraceae bacterium]
MNGKSYKRIGDLSAGHLLGTGTPMCAGCGGLVVVKEIYDILGEKTIFINAAGCMTLLANYPFTPFKGSWLYTAMASAPAGAQGVRDALDILLLKGRLPPEEDLEAVVLSGDGSAYGMGLSATSGAMDRNLDFLYICYDNEGYGNTGQQASAATPLGARTATSRGPLGYHLRKKDLFAVWAAHRPAYVATVSPSDPLDLARKLETAKNLEGSRLILAFAPCPTGWGFDPKETIEIGKLAVQSGVWPLKEYRQGVLRHTLIPRKRLAVEEYLRRQVRFSHLFLPQRNEELLGKIQSDVDAYWEGIKD